MSLMTSQILKFGNFTKMQKFRYLKNETLFFLQIKKFITSTSRATLCQKKFVPELPLVTSELPLTSNKIDHINEG